MIGCVRFFNDELGYGFIASENGGQDIFVSKVDLETAGMTSLHKGQKLLIEAETDRTGRKSVVSIRTYDPG